MRLPILRAREVIKLLKKVGFYEDHQKGSHLTFRSEERKCSVVIPVHPGTLPKGTLRAIIRQAKMTVREFCSYL